MALRSGLYILALVRGVSTALTVAPHWRFVVNDPAEANMLIPALLSPRKGFYPLLNPHGLSNVCNAGECGDFHVAMYFLDSHSCAVRVRRLDNPSWDFDLSVYIQTMASRSPAASAGASTGPAFTREILYLGSSAAHVKTLLLNTSLLLLPDRSINQAQLIPKTIVQTFATRRAHSIFHWNAHQTFAELNPEYELRMFTDRDCREFVKTHLPARVLEAYDLLISPTFKADVFRYAYLAVHGGCYFDHKMIARMPLRRVMRTDDRLLVCSDAHPNTFLPASSLQETLRLYNAVICSAPQDPRLWATLDTIVDNIARRHSTGSDLSLTGPVAFFNAIHNNLSEENVRFKHGVRTKSILQLRRKYEDYYVQEKTAGQLFLTKFYKGFHVDPHSTYGALWRARTVYYDLLLQHGPWKVYAFPGQRSCVRPDYTEAGTIVLNMLSTPSAYEPQLHNCQRVKVVILNDDTSDEYRVEIPSVEMPSATKHAFPLPFFDRV